MERRSSSRIDAGIPAEFDTATEPGHAGIVQDVSETGALLLNHIEHEWHEVLTVRFRAAGTGAELIERRARVVRSEPHDPESVWPVRTALEFDQDVELDRAKLAGS
ncbi:MAG: PilZ domain-containing protein [Sandaracinaceae bacterium]|nr:PilZ domain-containing protein [Sandaracinaceae bacterium]